MDFFLISDTDIKQMEKETENYEYYMQFSGARVLLDIFRLILSLMIEFKGLFHYCYQYHKISVSVLRYTKCIIGRKNNPLLMFIVRLWLCVANTFR